MPTDSSLAVNVVLLFVGLSCFLARDGRMLGSLALGRVYAPCYACFLAVP